MIMDGDTGNVGAVGSMVINSLEIGSCNWVGWVIARRHNERKGERKEGVNKVPKRAVIIYYLKCRKEGEDR